MNRYQKHLKQDLENIEVKAEYDRLQTEFALIEELILAKNEIPANELAKKVGVKKEELEFIEEGMHASLNYLHTLASTLGKTLHIELR
ncbi:MAG: transcriptional regulator [Firmicutes bacterium]|nr:transcriptional regulator [Bacillota bacterium]